MNNDDLSDFETMLSDALGAHGDAIDGPSPTFSALLAARQRAVRRNVALSSLAVLGLGAGGLAFAAGTNDSVTQSIPAPSGTAQTPVTTSPKATDVPDATVAPALPTELTTTTTTAFEWFCRGALGTDDEGRELFADCVPIIEFVNSDWACTDRLGLDEIGRVRFGTCEPVGQLGSLPGTDDSSQYDLGVVQPLRYTVQAGDYAIKIADSFCTTVDVLEHVNGWSDSSREFPGPDSQIMIPAFDGGEVCGTEYVIQSGDYPLLLTDENCVSLERLYIANANVEAFSTFVPGSVIIIPPTDADEC